MRARGAEPRVEQLQVEEVRHVVDRPVLVFYQPLGAQHDVRPDQGGADFDGLAHADEEFLAHVACGGDGLAGELRVD